MTVIWLRRYPTNEVLGYFFNVSASTASRMRHYKSLSQTDRHHRQRHASRTVAVAGLANRQMVARRVA
jgi:Helix-turn-helix of DDE superfamily endonuclease